MVRLHKYLAIIYAVCGVITLILAEVVVGRTNVELIDKDIMTTTIFAGTGLVGIALSILQTHMDIKHGVEYLVSSYRSLLVDLIVGPLAISVIWILTIGARILLSRWFVFPPATSSVYLWHLFGALYPVLIGLALWHLLCHLRGRRIYA
ncbi:MAG: hypothetical protein ACYC27_12760 [Armatimonadota bacterium]